MNKIVVQQITYIQLEKLEVFNSGCTTGTGTRARARATERTRTGT